jgi:S-adenosylmethionine hydrolase
VSAVVLLTDFGASDWYVAAMKGAILSREPDATLVDLSHAVPPGDVLHASFLLEQTWRLFPQDTVFVAIVDPGVGTARRPIAVRAVERMFVGPDNGVLTSPLEDPSAEIRVIDPARVGAHALSPVFHGRDLFAPAAALLAASAAFASLGELVRDPMRLAASRAKLDGNRAEALVVYVDRFGNAITDLREEELRAWLKGTDAAKVRVRAGTGEIVGVSRTYEDVAPEAPLALVGSTGRLEIAVHGGHAGARLGLGVGDSITLEKAG